VFKKIERTEAWAIPTSNFGGSSHSPSLNLRPCTKSYLMLWDAIICIMHVYMQVCMCACMCAYVCVWLCVCMQTMHVCMHAYVCMHDCMYNNACVKIYNYICEST